MPVEHWDDRRDRWVPVVGATDAQPKLRDGARRMLDRLIAYGGEVVSRETLFEESALEKSGTASAYLSDLRRAQLVLVSRDGVAANKETLFL